MLPNCKQIAEQASENIDTPLTGMAWVKLKLHLLICKHCNRYVNQIELSSKTVEAMNTDCEPNEIVKKNVEECYRELHVKQSTGGNKTAG